MGKSFQKLLPSAIFALLLLSSMGVVLGLSSRTEMFKEMAEEKYSIIQEMVMNSGNEDLKNAFLSAEVEALQCVGAGSYCNRVFGPDCCTSKYLCMPPSIVGGVCVVKADQV